MLFERIEPQAKLTRFIECFWVVQDSDGTPIVQKIIPDGFPELIFHFGDAFRINLDGRWETQEQFLLAGQIRKHFYLENTGKVDVIGVKLKPAAITNLFGLPAIDFTGKVVPFSLIENKSVRKLFEINRVNEKNERISFVEEQFLAFVSLSTEEQLKVENAIELIFEANGQLSVSELAKKTFSTERQLERLFKKYIGLSPKFYLRIVRFNNIFHSIEKKIINWAAVAYETGYYDQSHFIRDFKNFTGEDPSKYVFHEPTMANFFLRKNKS